TAALAFRGHSPGVAVGFQRVRWRDGLKGHRRLNRVAAPVAGPRNTSESDEPSLQPGERLPHRVAGERAEAERSPVGRLQDEVRTLASLDLVAGLEPDPLTDLVRRRLGRPAEVAVDLEDDGGVVHPAVLPHELQPQLAGPALARVEAERVVARDLELEVHADV